MEWRGGGQWGWQVAHSKAAAGDGLCEVDCDPWKALSPLTQLNLPQ